MTFFYAFFCAINAGFYMKDQDWYSLAGAIFSALMFVKELADDRY